MGIVNGTFDTDLHGWAPTITGNADVIWDNGKARLRVYKCIKGNSGSFKELRACGMLRFEVQRLVHHRRGLPVAGADIQDA